ncbi:MAG: zf-HC2 domain-containing protein [Bryobacter sp.]|nr:zf-HC2 domain-containing protein [Bryobacter sp.]
MDQSGKQQNEKVALDCQQVDELLCDYVDGTLVGDQRLALERHAAECMACGEYVADVAGSAQFLSRVADVEAPRELITRILHETPKPTPLLAKLSPQSLVRRWLAPLLQPRLAMGMAMTILSFSMIGKFASPTKQLTAADLDPARIVRNIDTTLHRAWDNAVKYYDNLRLVYEIQSAIDDIKGQESEAPKKGNEGDKK